MHPDQLHLDVATVRALVASQFPRWRELAVSPGPTGGTVNAIFRIGDSLAARFPLRPVEVAAARADLEQEAAALAEFADVSPFPAPRPVAIGDPGRGCPMPWSVQSWLPGDTATPVGAAGSTVLAADLARLVRALRTAPTRDRPFRGRGRGGILADHDEWMEHCLTRIGPFVDPAPLRSMWRGFRTLPPGATTVMTHGDLTPWNLLVGGDGRLRGVLDAGSFGPADPALDLVGGWHLLDGPARDVFRAAVGSDDAEWARGAGWAFEQAMGLVWYYDTSNPPMAWLGRTTLRRLLADDDVRR